jgi:hypothetical protein
MRQIVLFLFLLIGITVRAHAQKSDAAVKPAAADTAVAKKDAVKAKPEHSPRKAIIRSAIIPGWGQAYNKKYWKIPIVYGALGTAAGFFIYNRKEYIDARDAYRNFMDGDNTNNNLIKPKFRPVDPEAVRQYRIAVRQYVDYSVLAFVILWGLNVVDATVDGHLKAFEVTDNLSLHINPSYSPQTRQANLGFVLKLGK